MCLLVVAWQVHADYPLILAGNRDEFHDRPAAPLGWSTDWPDIAAGRDLKAGGTWLGVARDARLGVVTNFRDRAQPSPADAPSRGRLVPDYLLHDRTPAQFVEALEPTAGRYAGFNLLLADRACLYYASNRTPRSPRSLERGIYGLSNGELDEPWPKLVRARERFATAIEAQRPDPSELFALLADRTTATEPAMPGLPPDWQRAVSAPFVVHERYGTRCTTVVLIDREGRAVIQERRFDSNGNETGSSRLEFGGHEAPGVAQTGSAAVRATHYAATLASPAE
jgi:uncharacterized protein with NRDE domain